MRKLSVLFILPFSVTILSGCSNDEHVPIEVTNLKTAIQYISEEKNYKLTMEDDNYPHEFIYTENSIGVTSSKYPQIDDFHIQCDAGVFRLRYDNNQYISGEILSKGEILWGNDNYRKTMFGVSIDFLNDVFDDSTTVVITDKAFKMQYAYSIGYSLDNFPNIDSLTLDYKEDNGDKRLTFTLSYLGNPIVYVAHGFNTTKNEVVDNFLLEGGTYLTIDNNLKKIRDLIRGNNFSQAIYYFGEEESGYVGTSYFHEHYYAMNYYGSTAYTGVISLNSKAYDLKGIYYFTIIDNQMTINPQALYDVPSVPEYYHYPTFLALLDNFEYASEWTDQDMGSFYEEGYGYYISNMDLLNDFAYNFSISNNFSGQRPVGLAIDLVEDDNGGTIIYFYYKFTYQGAAYVMPIPLYNFGGVGNATLDKVYEQYND